MGKGRVWDGYGTDMGRIWDGYGMGMERVWDGYGTGMGWVWDGNGTGMGRLDHHLVCHQVWMLDIFGTFCRTFLLDWSIG